jgi:hypothetical protein
MNIGIKPTASKAVEAVALSGQELAKLPETFFAFLSGVFFVLIGEERWNISR